MIKKKTKTTSSKEPSILKIIVRSSMYFVSIENWSWSRVFHFVAGKKQVTFMELQSISELDVFDSAVTYRQKSKVFPIVNLRVIALASWYCGLNFSSSSATV